MNSDLTGGVYIKCREMFWVSSYKYQQAAVEADRLCGVGEVEQLLDREQADINIQRNVHKQVQVVFSVSGMRLKPPFTQPVQCRPLTPRTRLTTEAITATSE